MSNARAENISALLLAEQTPGRADSPSVPWPLAIPEPQQAELAIASALEGSSADAVAARVARELSPIESSAFDGIVLADPALLRVTASLRLRLATALATAPQSGQVDEAAALRLLADADAVLAAVGAASQEATETVRASLAAIRNDLVRDAVRVSDALQRLSATQGAPAAVPAAAPASPQARVLSNENADAPRPASRARRGAALWVVLAVAVLTAGGYHLDRTFQVKRARAQMARVDGAPERVVASNDSDGAQLLFTPQSAPLTASELERLRAIQRSRGRVVVQRAPGIYVLQKEPAAAAAR